MSFLKLQNTSSFKEPQLSEPPIDHWTVLHVYTHIQKKERVHQNRVFPNDSEWFKTLPL